MSLSFRVLDHSDAFTEYVRIQKCTAQTIWLTHPDIMGVFTNTCDAIFFLLRLLVFILLISKLVSYFISLFQLPSVYVYGPCYNLTKKYVYWLYQLFLPTDHSTRQGKGAFNYNYMDAYKNQNAENPPFKDILEKNPQYHYVI